MGSRALTIQLSDDLIGRLSERARHAHRSLEAEIVDILTEAAPEPEELPSDVKEALRSLRRMTDEELWAFAKGHIPQEAAKQLELLSFKQQSEGLTDEEALLADRLAEQYDLAVLLRAEAAALLRERGHDITPLLASR